MGVLGFRVYSEFRVLGFFGFWGLGFRVWGFWGLGLRAQGRVGVSGLLAPWRDSGNSMRVGLGRIAYGV